MYTSYNLSSMVLTSLTFKLKVVYHSTWTASTHGYQKKSKFEIFIVKLLYLMNIPKDFLILAHEILFFEKENPFWKFQTLKK
jgi:hypothetical protein